MTNGQIAYEAYRAKVGAVSVGFVSLRDGVSLSAGDPLPEYVLLGDEIREAWEAAGDAIAQAEAEFRDTSRD